MEIVLKATVEEAREFFKPVVSYALEANESASPTYNVTPMPLANNAIDFALEFMCRAGEVILAIKLRRAVYNESLRDAKEHVDRVRGR